MNLSKIIELLFGIEHILSKFNHDKWASQVKGARILISSDALAGKSEVLRLYGGLGSLTDIVLYIDGIPLIAENNKLHDMCEELYKELYNSDNDCVPRSGV